MTDKQERTTRSLPPDSSGLFQNGEVQEHNILESFFIEDDIGTDVTEFDLTNVDTSNVQYMTEMFRHAESFNQDIGGWDTSNVQDMRSMFAHTRFTNRRNTVNSRSGRLERPTASAITGSPVC